MPESLPEGAGSARYRILLIDDDWDLVEPLAIALHAAGHDVRVTTQGDDLPRLLKLVNPHVLVTDVIMAAIDTLETISGLRQSHPDMKIIAISGNPHLLTLASKLGAHHTLAMPFRLHKLSLLIKVAMQ